MLYPIGSETIFYEVVGAGNVVLVSGTEPKTILNVSMQQENVSSNTIVRCGDDNVAKNYATNFSQVTMNYQCDDTINILKTGNDSASVIVTYAPFYTNDLSTTTYNPSTSISSSTDIQIYGAFSAGEVFMSLLLFSMIVLYLINMLAQGLSAVKTSKKYLQYNGGDVEIRNDL